MLSNRWLPRLVKFLVLSACTVRTSPVSGDGIYSRAGIFQLLFELFARDACAWNQEVQTRE